VGVGAMGAVGVAVVVVAAAAAVGMEAEMTMYPDGTPILCHRAVWQPETAG